MHDIHDIYRESLSKQVKISSKAYRLIDIPGISIFPSKGSELSPHNALYIIIDPILKEINVIKYDYIPFW